MIFLHFKFLANLMGGIRSCTCMVGPGRPTTLSLATPLAVYIFCCS